MYEIFLKLLQARGLKAADVCRGTGLPSSLFSEWKKGKSTPKADKMKKIADFFGVSTEYLMTGSEPENSEKYYLNDETAAMAQELFENKELRVLFDAARTATPEDLKTTYDLLLALKRKERGYIDDTGC